MHLSTYKRRPASSIDESGPLARYSQPRRLTKEGSFHSSLSGQYHQPTVNTHATAGQKPCSIAMRKSLIRTIFGVTISSCQAQSYKKR